MFALAVVVLSLLVLGSVATAGERSVEGPAEEMPGGSAQGRAQVERLIEEDVRRREAREAELAGSDARAARARSRGAHKVQSEQEARALLRREFGGLLDSLFFDPAELADGGRITEYVGDYAAVVETATGPRLLESQGLPLRARDRSGRRSRVDLELRDRGVYVAPGNPLVELRLPERLDDGLAFGSDGVRIHLESAPGDVVGALLDDRRMVYQVGSDTEFVAQPTGTGVELFWQLRSEDSPQRQTLRFELPEGARLREAQGGAIELVRGDEKLAEVAPPRAIDAQGQDVPTSMSLRGEEINVTARHAGGDFAYPILLDPVVQDWNAFILRSDALAYWRYYTNRTDRFQTQFVCNPFVSCGTGEGLFHYAPPGPYNHNDFAESFYAPPCTDARYSESCDGTLYLNGGSPVTRSTYITYLRFPNSFHDRQGATYNSGAVVGVWRPSVADWSVLNVTTSTYADSLRIADPPDTTTDGNTAVFALYQYTGVATPTSRPTWASHYTGGAYMLLSDRENPITRIRSNTAPTDWTRTATSFDFEVESYDPGLGAKEIRVQTPTGATITGLGPTRTDLCGGNRELQCPRSYVQNFNASTENLPDGSHTFQVSSTDILGKGSATIPISYKLDRGAPEVTVSGELKEAQGGTVFPGDYTLRVDAADGDASTPQSERSGVRTAEVLVDGTRWDFVSQQCPSGSCALNPPREWVLDTRLFAVGEHTVEIRVEDQVGNTTTERFPVTIAPRPVEPDEPLEDGDDGAVPDGGFGEAEISDYCTSDAEAETGYCGELDAQNSALQDALNEPALDPLVGAASIRRSGYGMSDNKREVFDDPRLNALGLTRVRLIVPFDVVARGEGAQPGSAEALRLEDVDLWMMKVRQAKGPDSAGYEPLVSFEKSDTTDCASRRPGESQVQADRRLARRCVAPTPGQYAFHVAEFRKRYADRRAADPALWPTLRYFTAWNEPNHPRQPTRRFPETAGRYWRTLMNHCKHDCTVAAGDFSDSFKDQLRAYVTGYKSGMGYKSGRRIWAWHPYSDGRRKSRLNADGTTTLFYSADRLREFLRVTDGPVWLTEQGPLYFYKTSTDAVRNINRSAEGEDNDAGANSDLLQLLRLETVSTRITRFYYYNWEGGDTFDSGLTDFKDSTPRPDKRLRPLYATYDCKVNGRQCP